MYYQCCYALIKPWRMRKGYDTCSVIRCPSSCRDQRSLLCTGKVMSMISMTMACIVTRGFAKVPSFSSYDWLTLTAILDLSDYRIVHSSLSR